MRTKSAESVAPLEALMSENSVSFFKHRWPEKHRETISSSLRQSLVIFLSRSGIFMTC